MTILRSALFAALTCLVLPCAAARAGVIVVDPAGGGDFTFIEDAVAAAVEGDTILIKAGFCGICFDGEIHVVGKSLTIVFDPPTSSTFPPRFTEISVRDLQAGQLVVLRGLTVEPVFVGGLPGIWLEDDAGTVWIEDCDVRGWTGDGAAPLPCAIFANIPGGPAIRASNCSIVTVVGSTLQGGNGKDANTQSTFSKSIATAGGLAVEAVDSHVAIYASALTGGEGGSGSLCGEHAAGGDGISAASSAVLLSGCTVTGGAPAAGSPAGAYGNGLQGDGLSSYELLGTDVIVDPSAVAFDTAPGTVVQYTGSARIFSLPSPQREGQAGTLEIQGEQGDVVGFYYSFDGGYLPMPARQGWFVLGTTFLAGPFVLGAITDAGGVWNLDFITPDLPPALQSATFLVQAWFEHTGGVTLGSGTAFTLVDSSY